MMHIEALTYVTNTVYRQNSRSSMSVKLSRVIPWDMEQQYQDTMTLTWLSTPELIDDIWLIYSGVYK